MSLKLNYDDITIVPEVITSVSSRSECNPYDNNGYLPIFASCMSSVVSLENTPIFNKNKIRVVIPRTYSYTTRIARLISDRINFIAFSLNETKELFQDENLINSIINTLINDETINLCIDLANGHMENLINIVKTIKSKYNNKIIIMTGNIANPETYKVYDEAGVDFCRCSIGTGAGCITSSLTGVHYPIFSLLKEIYEIKQNIGGKCKIIADGGIREYRDIQKALIYADYVMIGSVFNKAIESAGETRYGKFYWNFKGIKIFRPLKTIFKYGKIVNPHDYPIIIDKIKKNEAEVWKEYYGMASKKSQKLINKANKLNNKLKTSEGKVKYYKVEFSLNGWVENEIDALRSAMSYTNSKTLEEYKNSPWVINMNIAYNK